MSIEGESFVILGSSPTPSMDSGDSLPSVTIESSIKQPEVDVDQLISFSDYSIVIGSSPTPSRDSGDSLPSVKIESSIKQPEVDVLKSFTSDYSIVTGDCKTPESESKSETADVSVTNSSAANKSIDTKLTSSMYNLLQSAKSDDPSVGSENKNATVGDQKPRHFVLSSMSGTTSQSTLSGNKDGSLAVSFLMGDVSPDVLKNVVHSQFPSICQDMAACPEDIVKLQNLITEYQDLKTTLNKSFLTMKQMYNNAKKSEEKMKLEDEMHKSTIAKLSNEILEQKKEINLLRDQLKLSNETREKEHSEYVRSLSEKTAQIQNMTAHIQKLEADQLSSFDVIPKNSPVTETETDRHLDNKTEYISTIEHDQIVKRLLAEMSELTAENLEIKDMQKQYIEEINLLKVNQVAAEELYQKAQADIDFLKASDLERNALLVKFDNERQAQAHEKEVLLQQLEIYSKDFKIEQEARQILIQEKVQLVSDLADLQQRNQELVAEAQKAREDSSQPIIAIPSNYSPHRPATASPSPPGNTRAKHVCPLCGLVFHKLRTLEDHVDLCLEAN